MKKIVLSLFFATSFSVQGGSGSKNERALMYAHVRRMEALVPYEKELRSMFQLQNYVSNKSWNNDVAWYEKRVVDAGEDYIQRMQKTLTELNELGSFDEAMEYIRRFGWDTESNSYQQFIVTLHRRFG